MLHSFHELQRLLQQNVVSTPDQRPLHPNGISLDVHLGASLYVEDTSQMHIVDLAKREPFAYKPVVLTPDDPCFTLSPGSTVIACTEEVFSLQTPLSIAGGTIRRFLITRYSLPSQLIS